MTFFCYVIVFIDLVSDALSNWAKEPLEKKNTVQAIRKQELSQNKWLKRRGLSEQQKYFIILLQLVLYAKKQ